MTAIAHKIISVHKTKIVRNEAREVPEPRLKRLALPRWGGRSFLHGVEY
jgi:hypothetical protein